MVPVPIDTFLTILPYAAIVAGVGLMESLLTLNLLDEIAGTRGRSYKECMAQGAANVLSGLQSGMDSRAMIGQCLFNVSSGARARLSGFAAAVMLLVFVKIGAPQERRGRHLCEHRGGPTYKVAADTLG